MTEQLLRVFIERSEWTSLSRQLPLSKFALPHSAIVSVRRQKTSWTEKNKQIPADLLLGGQFHHLPALVVGSAPLMLASREDYSTDTDIPPFVLDQRPGWLCW